MGFALFSARSGDLVPVEKGELEDIYNLVITGDAQTLMSRT